MRIVVFVVCFSIITLTKCHHDDVFRSTLGHLKPSSSESIQAQAALKLINRFIPKHANQFTITIDQHFSIEGKDTFHIKKSENNIVTVRGTTGVTALWGLHHYLKYYCNAHISWEATQLNLPEILPNVDIVISANDRFRYYQNLRTSSLSFVWWTWKEWEQHIDWMALNGINLALAFTGQEEIWRRVYTKFGLTLDEIDNYLGGPAFLSWTRFGNINGWPGTLPETWHQKSIQLQKQILKRMRQLGIIPVLPAFQGQVPDAIQRLFPDAKLTKMNSWKHFQQKYCCPNLLDPIDPLFHQIGTAFMQEQISEFGTDHVYSSNTFIEMKPNNISVEYLQKFSSSIYSTMTQIDPEAVWLIQGEMFYNNEFTWEKEQIQSYVNAIPLGRMIITDTQSEQEPHFLETSSYFGQPFIWCMLHNIGGTLGMFGSADKINTEVFKGRTFNGSTMVGTGLTPEGINQNYVIYDLMMEMFWRREPTNLTIWFSQYATRRYGQSNANATKAWLLLKDTVYNYNNYPPRMTSGYMITKSPSLDLNISFWYDTKMFEQAWFHLLQASDYLQNNEGYQHDLVDVTRQALQIIADLYYPNLIHSFQNEHLEEFLHLWNMYKKLFKDLNTILASNEAFLLGKWLAAAKSFAISDSEAFHYEFNARYQILRFGPLNENINYANKQWAGIVSHVYGQRWNNYIAIMNHSLINQKPFNQNEADLVIFRMVDSLFATDDTIFPSTPTGDSISIAKIIFNDWRTKIKNYMPFVRRKTENVNYLLV